MDTLVEDIYTIDYDDLINIQFPYKRFGLVVYKNDVKFEFLVDLKEFSEDLIVLGSGAVSPKHDRSRPFLNRWSWEFESSAILYNDPTLYISNKLGIGWGIGYKEDWYLKTISEIILIISDSINIKNKDILFYSSSGGGFMSIMLSILVKDSKALADIPQFDIKLFGQNRTAFERIKKYCFPELSDEFILEKYGHRFSVIDFMNKEKYIPDITLVCDCSVTGDFTTQYLPFFKRLNDLPFNNEKDNRIKIITNGRNKGHTPLSKDETFSLINQIQNNNSIDNFNLDSKNKWVLESTNKFYSLYSNDSFVVLKFNSDIKYNLVKDEVFTLNKLNKKFRPMGTVVSFNRNDNIKIVVLSGGDIRITSPKDRNNFRVFRNHEIVMFPRVI